MPERADHLLMRDTVALAERLYTFLDRLEGAEQHLAPAQKALGDFVAVFQTPVEDGEPAREAGAPLARVLHAFALSNAERDLLLLAGLPEQHEALSNLMRALNPRGEPRPTLALAAQFLCQSPAERLLLRAVLERAAAERPGILRFTPDDAPFYERSLLLQDGLWSALGGHPGWPVPFTSLPEGSVRQGLSDWLCSPPVEAALRALRGGAPVTLVVYADSEDVALERAAALVDEAGVPFAKLAVQGLLSAPVERRLSVLAVAHGVVPVLKVSSPEGPRPPPLPSFLGHPGPVVMAARTGTEVLVPRRALLTVVADRPSASARARMWRELVPALAEAAPELASRYALEPCAVRDIAVDLQRHERQEGRAPTMEDVVASVRARLRSGALPGIQVRRPTAGWGSLVIGADRLCQLREAVDRLRQQARVLEEWRFLAERPGARGVRMLFAGPPGTGKTLSAEVLACELGTDLLVVDISRVVSKWIGETEKNLSEVFDAAERTHAVLFFDEADALFGRRTEVSDAHDRYANLETAYLLGRLECFEGMAILSTNLRQNVDPAFLRRLEFVVDYEEPGPVERLALWRAHVPGDVPLERDVDFRELATLYPVVGGLIRNAAVAAAFLAASEGGPIRRVHFIRAIRREYEKAGRAFPGAPPSLTLEPH
jgi:hypothetical protein